MKNGWISKYAPRPPLMKKLPVFGIILGKLAKYPNINIQTTLHVNCNHRWIWWYFQAESSSARAICI